MIHRDSKGRFAPDPRRAELHRQSAEEVGRVDLLTVLTTVVTTAILICSALLAGYGGAWAVNHFTHLIHHG